MRDRLYYINHLNERIDLGKADILLNENNARSYSWETQSLYDKIIGFKKGMQTIDIPLIVYGPNRKETLARIIDVTEKDIIDKEPGVLYCGTCYRKGYIVASEISAYTNDASVNKTISFVSDSDFWIYESFYSHAGDQEATGEGKGYPYDYAYDYKSALNSDSLIIQNYNGAQARLVIFGYVKNPTIIIGGKEYTINCEVLKGEYLEIDTATKTIILTKANGDKVNKFADRYPTTNFFRKIDRGSNAIQAPDSLKFVVYALQERSEPLWI